MSPYSNLLRVNWWVFVKCEPKSSQLKGTKDLNYFSLSALHLFNTQVSQFELNYWNKWTFPRHSNLLRCTCIYIYIYIYIWKQKGLFIQKLKFCYHQLVPNTVYIYLNCWIQKKIFWRMLATKHLTVAIDLHSIKKWYYDTKSKATVNCLVTIFFSYLLLSSA